MKVIIAGSRSISDWPPVANAITLSGFKITEVVSGGATSVDTWGEEWAERHGIPVKRFPAQWKTQGRAAGMFRNREMAQYADALAVFTGGAGTTDMVIVARRFDLQIFDYRTFQPCRVVAPGEPYDLSICRPGPWGNPFIVGKDGSHKTVIQKHRLWLPRQEGLMAELEGLRGLRLGCSKDCSPGNCHGDIIAELVNQLPQ